MLAGLLLVAPPGLRCRPGKNRESRANVGRGKTHLRVCPDVMVRDLGQAGVVVQDDEPLYIVEVNPVQDLVPSAEPEGRGGGGESDHPLDGGEPRRLEVALASCQAVTSPGGAQNDISLALRDKALELAHASRVQRVLQVVRPLRPGPRVDFAAWSQ